MSAEHFILRYLSENLEWPNVGMCLISRMRSSWEKCRVYNFRKHLCNCIPTEYSMAQSTYKNSMEHARRKLVATTLVIGVGWYTWCGVISRPLRAYGFVWYTLQLKWNSAVRATQRFPQFLFSSTHLYTNCTMGVIHMFCRLCW